ncbi:GT2 family glycosyltransferase [Novosphingobium sp. PhB165]|uniref:glycosyltransferase n=1 Tax=Novosphingobium sp. PhB165 TaxID=2485105 RepID=UPI0010D3D00A|nr:glycosyltransferase [Novosphingobium sp. PhB165]TCM20502.1 GT2 family glycosyltransferase [Novosphingobium sp. PhB165]
MSIMQDVGGNGGAVRNAAVGVVVIGRNEGERLPPCLQSARLASDRVVYVDSGSKDGSAALARTYGIEVIELDTSSPFTAARGRNTGFARVRELWPDTEFVQFIDGDCELDSHWIAAGLAGLANDARTAVVFGRRRERYPDQTFFNRVCDIEWDGKPGPTDSCGGDALMRVEAVSAVGGYDPGLIAAEDNDLCHRIRRRGWNIVRLPDEMTLHDAAMTTWWQWWQRNRRSGHAGAEAWYRRGSEDPRMIRYLLSNLLWALPPFWLLWPVLWWRVYRRSGASYATHIVLGKVPHCFGQLGFCWTTLRARKTQLIEYK